MPHGVKKAIGDLCHRRDDDGHRLGAGGFGDEISGLFYPLRGSKLVPPNFITSRGRDIGSSVFNPNLNLC